MSKTWVFAISLIAIFFLPTGGNPTPFALMDKVSTRLAVPITDQEQAQLDLLTCIEQTAGVIPDLSRVEKVLPEEDSFIVQRVGDIMYPRIRFDAENPQFRLYVNKDPGSAILINSATCGQMFVGVEKVD